jgi:uncharacterized peroxidase-related enzyme
MAWIRTIDPDDATGRLAEAYAWQAHKLGRPTEFTQLGSLDAELVYVRLNLYRASENVPSHLSVAQRVLIAYVTSVLNETPHCAALARAQLCSLPDGAALVHAVDTRDWSKLSLPDAALARYTEKLTLRPGSITPDDIEHLRAQGFSDLDILDANNQCAHLNYTNRVANGLGLLTEPAESEQSRERIPT